MARLNKTPLTIRAKRGTEAQITANPYQLEGEIAYATDTNKFFVSNGSVFLPFKQLDNYYAEMYQYENSTATTIGTQDVYHAINDFGAGMLSGFTFVPGIEGSIASVADYSGTVAGTILITDVSHGLETGDIITVHATTNYNGTYEITKVTNDTFYVTATYVATETGEWAMGSYLLTGSGSDGVYRVSFSLSAYPANPNENFKFELNKNTDALDNTAAERLFGNTSDYGVSAGKGIISLAGGDRIWLSVMNKTSGANLTVAHANVSLERL